MIYLIMKIGDDPKIMGEERHPAWVRFFGWFAFVAMLIAVVTMLVLQFV